MEWTTRVWNWVMSERGRNTLTGLLLLLNFVLIVVFLFTTYRGFLNSDSAVRNLLAQEMVDTGSFFPPGWNYVNKDLMVVFAQLGVWPLLYLFGNSYTLFAVVGVFCSALILASAWWFTGLFGGATWQRLLALAALSGGLSAVAAEGMFGQSAYGFMLMLTCLTAVLAWKSLTVDGKPRPLWWALLFVLVTLSTWSNPQRAVATYMLPVYCGLGAMLWGQGWKTRLKSCLPVLLATFAGVLVGAALSGWTLTQVNNNSGVGVAIWLDFDGMMNNAIRTLQGLIALMGGLPTKGTSMVDGLGIYQALRLVAALVLLVMMTRKVVQLCASHDSRARFGGGVVAGAASCFVFLQVTSTIPDMNDPVSVSRYLLPSLALGLLALLSSPLVPGNRLSATVKTGLGLLLAFNTALVFNPESMLYKGWYIPGREELIQEIEAKGGRYGYASYWEASPVTVLSGGKVTVRPIVVINGELLPMRHLSSDRWYEPEAWDGETFLLLSDAEAATVNWGILTRHLGQPVREERIGLRTMYVFKENMSRHLPGWSLTLHDPLRIDASPDGARTVGKWADAVGGLQAKPGEGGYLHFGPYSSLAAGNYIATFDVTGTAENPSQVVGTVDAAAYGGKTVMGTTEVLGNGKQQYVVKFQLERPVRNLELRVVSNATGNVVFKGVTLAQAQ